MISSEDTRVLVVDDERDVAESLADLLEAMGHAVTIAASAEEGLAHYSQGRYDVVLMDMRLPGMDGIDATERLVDLDPAAAVYIVTGEADGSKLARARASSARGVLRKPFAPRELLRIVSSHGAT